MINITFTPDWVSAIAAAVSCLFAIGYFVLLLINALIIYGYFLATKKQAKAAWKMVGFAQKELEPNVQIKLTEENREINGGDFKGLILNRNGSLTIPVILKNLSKGVSEFSIEIEKFRTYISATVGTIRMDPTLINLQSRDWPAVLKIGEEFETPLIVFDLRSSFEKEGYDLSNVGILSGSTLSVVYSIIYPGGRDPYVDYWQITFEQIEELKSEGWLLMGKWLIIHREKRSKGDQ